jgi:DNA-directed RNA polymerase subunit E'/Rpb7
MQTKSLTKWVKIHPSWLGNTLKDNIKIHLNKSLTNTCDKINGYFIDILSVNEIIDSVIENSSSDIRIKVVFDVRVYKPVIGDIIKAEILNIYPEGIFSISHGVLKSIVPSSTYDKHSYNVSDNIDIKIVDLIYEDKQFKCIANLL